MILPPTQTLMRVRKSDNWPQKSFPVRIFHQTGKSRQRNERREKERNVQKRSPQKLTTAVGRESIFVPLSDLEKTLTLFSDNKKGSSQRKEMIITIIRMNSPRFSSSLGPSACRLHIRPIMGLLNCIRSLSTFLRGFLAFCRKWVFILSRACKGQKADQKFGWGGKNARDFLYSYTVFMNGGGLCLFYSLSTQRSMGWGRN